METQLSMSLFHNTLDLPESELKARQLKAGSQNQIVYAYFYSHPYLAYTPVEVWQFLINRGLISSRTPVTSIRRSMTDLTTEFKLLKKTKEKKPGEYGIDNFMWRLLIT
jgi:hypothetical protein